MYTCCLLLVTIIVYAQIDVVRFMVNRKIFLVGFGLYGSIDSPAEYSVNIQVSKTLVRDVNETLGSETETRPRRFMFSPRRDRDRDRDLPTLCRDRDETETFKFWVRDETETEMLRGRDRDVFRDVGTLGYLK